MSNPPALQSCTICDKENTNYCARCKSTSYCSTSCQKDDWSTHKLLCATFSTFSASNRPTKNHYRAVRFDPDKAKPEFTWIFCKWLRDDDNNGGHYQSPKTAMIIGDDCFGKHERIQDSPRLRDPPPNTIFIVYRDGFLVDGSQSNKSIAAINATRPGEYHDWRGPIVAYAKLGQGFDPPACKDFDMVDFRHVADYFLSYGYIPPNPQTPQQTNMNQT